MPRPPRHWANHACYHITHRCHERRFLFRFAKYRNLYRSYLFEATRRYNVFVLSYVVTSNHVHVLVATGDRGRPQVSEALQYVHGQVAQHYNLIKEREGSFWSNRFHASRVKSGTHLHRCLFYIDMNMVRVGKVKSPEDWPQSSAHELAAGRKRYRIVDREKLMGRMGFGTWPLFQEWYQSNLRRILDQQLFMGRQSFWSESVAVGDQGWLEKVAGASGMKRYDMVEADTSWLESIKTVFLRRKNHAKTH